jgi:tetratricopeptide (TPR) repeat protein
MALSGLYFLKKDSADGRLLIWRCTYEMLQDKPVQGFGYGGFKANYMNYQAKYFEEHPDSEYALLADNVNRPFNEYLLLLSNYGLMGFILFLAFAWFLWKSFRKNRNKSILVRISGCCLLSIGVFALFSYPLVYPFVWLMGILSVLVIIRQAKYSFKIPIKTGRVLKLILIPIIMLFGVKIYQRMTDEMKWYKIAHKSLLGQTEQMLPEYQLLYGKLQNNELFLYNYAAELNVVKQYDKSLAIAKECERLWADYDLQMLIADNYQNIQQYEEAESHYIKASNMCPVRFMPLYELVEVYNETGRKEDALVLARKIIGKEVKIPSSTVSSIKHKMQQLIERESSPAPESRKSDESINKQQPRRVNLLEQQTPKELLPP